MDSIVSTATNSELYSLALVDAPYVIWAYAIIWVALMGYVTAILLRILRLQKDMDALAAAMEAKGIKASQE